MEKSEVCAIELSRLRKVAVERKEEMWKAACEVRSVRVERDTVKAELESVRVELVGTRWAVDCEEPRVWRFGASGSLEGDILMVRWDRKMAVEERVAADKREGATFLENERLVVEVKRLEEGKVLKEVYKKTGPMELNQQRARVVEAGVQAGCPKVTTNGVMTDVTNVQVVRETTYASVASQACPGMSPAAGDVDVEMGGTGGGYSGPPPVPVVPADAPVPEVVRAQALWIHGVDCRHGVGALLVAARRLRVGECTVHGVRWPLGFDRRWGKRLSSVVVYLDRPMVVRGNLVWFGGALHPVERYVFGR